MMDEDETGIDAEQIKGWKMSAGDRTGFAMDFVPMDYSGRVAIWSSISRPRPCRAAKKSPSWLQLTKLAPLPRQSNHPVSA
jgi:hypothetical protein